jgi:hypothetical protein
MAEATAGQPVTCLHCGIPDPPPDVTCDLGTGATLRDHMPGTEHGCPSCGRVTEACVGSPCQDRRAALEMRRKR